MAQIIADRVRETSTTTGAGALTLAGAAVGFRTFASVCAVADTVYYCIVSTAGDWEVGLGTYSAASTLTRTTVLASSNAGAAVTLPAGAQDVFLTQPASALGAASLARDARTANTALAAADKGKWIDITAGSFTQTAAAVATLGSGWSCWLSNSGTGDITLDPFGAELIDGLTSYVMYPGEVRLLQCDGVALRSIVIAPFYRVFTASGTFVKPPGYQIFEAKIWGGGGGGGFGPVSPYYGAGGGGGACHQVSLLSSALLATETVTVGAGGAAMTAEGIAPAGGTSTFSSASAFGGGGGVGSSTSHSWGSSGGGQQGVGQYGGASVVVGGAPSSPTGGVTTNNVGFGGGSGQFGSGVWGGGGGGGANGFTGGASIHGGGGGGAANNAGGTSKFGGNGGAGNYSGTASNGSAPGGGGGGVGGSGNNAGASTGAGGRGEVRIWGAT